MVPLWLQVRSVPGELSTDTNAVLRLAQASGHVAKPQLIQVSAASLCFPHMATATCLYTHAVVQKHWFTWKAWRMAQPAGHVSSCIQGPTLQPVRNLPSGPRSIAIFITIICRCIELPLEVPLCLTKSRCARGCAQGFYEAHCAADLASAHDSKAW